MQTGSVQGSTAPLGLYANKPPKPGSPPSFDPKDANRDGMVTFAEADRYSLNHPEATLLKQLRTPKPSVATSNPGNAPFTAAIPPWQYGRGGMPSIAQSPVKNNLDLLA
jgi:hypothetical protein